MATSGSVDFSISRDNVITDALLLLGQLTAGEPVSTEETTIAARRLNAMVKRWQAKGIKLWKVAEAVVFLEASKAVYEIGGVSPADRAAYRRVEDVAIKTELAADALSGATTISVDSISGIANLDKIGIVQNTGTVRWTTVSGAPSGSSVVLAAGLTANAATDNHVYAFTTNLPRPLQVVEAQLRNADEIDIPVQIISRQEYQDLPNKSSTGVVTQIYYNPQRDKGYLYTWPVSDTANSRLIFTAYLPLEDFDAAGDTPDFPQEWYDPLAFNLAVELAPMYGVVGDEKLELAAQAKAYLNDVQAWNVEEESIYFQPDTRFYD
jgi:hypothetical protein